LIKPVELAKDNLAKRLGVKEMTLVSAEAVEWRWGIPSRGWFTLRWSPPGL